MRRGGTFAAIVTLNNELRVYKVAPIYGRLFFVADLGFFLLDEEHRYILENKAEFYIYDQPGTNSESITAMEEWVAYCRREKKERLDFKDLAMFVDKIRRVELKKELKKQLLTDPEAKATPNDILEMDIDGTLDYMVETQMVLTKPDLAKFGVSESAVAWLNSYFKEEVTSRYYLQMRQITDEKSKLKESKTVTPLASYMTPIGNKKNIALVIINNALVKVDVKVKVEMNYDKGCYVLQTSDYGSFDIKDAKSRMKCGRQNVYAVLVDTAQKPKPTPKDAEKIAA